MLTHESQFAGCGKQEKRQNERTEQKLVTKLLLMPNTFTTVTRNVSSAGPML